jgi:hypothetical protein
MSEDDDRMVHAKTHSGGEIVRYDRAGKWYLEQPGFPRLPVSVSEAAGVAVVNERHAGGTIFLGKPGGRSFDARVRARRLIQEPNEETIP